MEYRATQKFVVTSPRKLREVVAMIKGLSPVAAVERLPFTNKAANEPILKVIKTAIANAKQKSVNPQDLIFSEIQIGEGPRLKRFRAGSRGRAKPYKRRMSHIRVVLTTRKSETTNSKSETKIHKDEKVVTELVKTNVAKPKTASKKGGKK